MPLQQLFSASRPLFMLLCRSTVCTLLFLSVACSTDALLAPPPSLPDVVEGQRTTLLLSFQSHDPIHVTSRASLTDEKERELLSMAIFIFDNDGRMVSSSFHDKVAEHVCDANGNPLNTPLSPEGTNYLPVETLTGNDRSIYVIVNYEANIIQELKAVTSENHFKELVFEVLANPLAREFGMSKVGGVASTQVRHGVAIEVPLRYVSAKITLNVINEYAQFVVEGWTVDNLPTKSYVWERTPDFIADPNYHDASDTNDENDYYHNFADQRFLFESLPAAGASLGTYSTVFYMTENRRGGRIRRDAPPAGWPYGSEADGAREEYQLKSWYAPSKATYVKVYGTLTDASGNKQLVTIKHYLGADNSADYNVNRATNYTYNIKISTLGKIKIDTNVELTSSLLRVDTPADAMILDAHYGFRMFRIHSHEITDPDYSVRAEVLQAPNSTEPASWLNLAITPIVMHQLKSADANIAMWQQSGGAVGSYVRPQFIPNKAARNALSVAGMPYTPPAGVTLGSDEYPDDDTSLPFTKSIRRMCKQITSLPTKAYYPALTDRMNIMVYADEYPFDNSPSAPAYREAVVRFAITKGGADVEYLHFTIRQYPPHRFLRLAGQAEVMLVERVEEYEHMLMPTMPFNFQLLAGLQWGPYDLPSATNAANGSSNTLAGVYTSGGSSRSADYYLTKYGSEAGGWSYSNNALIAEPGTMGTNNPYFALPAIDDPNHLNVIYNTTAARYCHEKNWDSNGNGNIDAHETFWYLPSLLELQQMWTLHELLNMRPDYYWTSVQADSEKAFALSMMSSASELNKVYNGVPQQFQKSNTHFINRPRVRCMRRASGITPLAPLVLHRTDNSTVIDCAVLPASVHSSESKMGITQADPGALHQANAKLFRKFEVSRTQHPPTNYYSLHFGNGLCNQSQGWRLPTQREALLMWVMKNELEAHPSFAKFVAADYWTMNRDLSSRYLVNFASGMSSYEPFQGMNLSHYYRCVREVQ